MLDAFFHLISKFSSANLLLTVDNQLIYVIFNDFVQFLLEIACRTPFDSWQFTKHPSGRLAFGISIRFTQTHGVAFDCVLYKVTL